RQFRNFSSRVSLGICRVDRSAIFHVVDLPGLSANHDDVDSTINDLINSPRLKIYRRQPGGRSDEQPFTIRCVGILMKIEALAAGLIRQSNHAMSCIRVYPLARNRLTALSLCVHRDYRSRRQEKNQRKQKNEFTN